MSEDNFNKRKTSSRKILLDILDPGRHTRGLVWFERPGCICFNVDKALANQKKRAAVLVAMETKP